MKVRHVKRERVTPKLLEQMVQTTKERAQKNCKKKFRLMVSPDFIHVFEKAKQKPIMISGLFYDVDETLEGICCYCVDVWAMK